MLALLLLEINDNTWIAKYIYWWQMIATVFLQFVNLFCATMFVVFVAWHITDKVFCWWKSTITHVCKMNILVTNGSYRCSPKIALWDDWFDRCGCLTWDRQGNEMVSQARYRWFWHRRRVANLCFYISWNQCLASPMSATPRARRMKWIFPYFLFVFCCYVKMWTLFILKIGFRSLFYLAQIAQNSFLYGANFTDFQNNTTRFTCVHHLRRAWTD